MSCKLLRMEAGTPPGPGDEPGSGPGHPERHAGNPADRFRLRQPMLDVAARRGLDNLVCGRHEPALSSASYDAVTVAFGLRNMASYPDALREMGRMPRPGPFAHSGFLPA
ncbi:MAG: class I SAM-dependent methyltransferase [Akkermansia sp.]